MLNHNVIGRGSYLRCFHFARELVRMGHFVKILTASEVSSVRWRTQEEEGVRIAIPPRFGKLGNHDGGYAPVDILARIPTALGKWDLIHAFEHRPNVSLPALVSRLRGTPLVSDWSDWWTKGGITTSRRRLSLVDRWEGTLIEEGSKRISDRVTLVSKTLWDRAVGIGIPEDRLHLVPSGCDSERIRPMDKKECRRRLNLPEEIPVLCFTGFAFWDFSFLVEAFKEVLGEFPNTMLLVAGEDKEGTIGDTAKRVLGDSAGQVAFAGRFEPSELQVPLGASDLQLLPLPDNLANRARWPIKFGDYLASGRPCVLCDVGDSAKVAREEEVGEVTSPHPQAFASGILRLLRDPERGIEMGKRARTLAEGKLSWGAQAEKLVGVYEKCLTTH